MHSQAVHPLHVVFLTGTIPLFLGAMLSDIAYASSYHIQWNNFASWLIAGGLLFAGITLIFAIAGVFRTRLRRRNSVVYAVLLLLTWIIGFLNALIHAKDAWASMPAGLILSVIITVLICIATWMAFYTLRSGGPR